MRTTGALDHDGRLRILQEINRQVVALEATPVEPGANATVVAGNTPAQPQPATLASAGSTSAGTPTYTEIGPPVTMGPVSNGTQPQVATANVSQQQAVAINQFLIDWLDAWQRKDINAYFNHYEADFKTAAFASHDDWRADRIAKISRPLAIQITLQNLKIEALDASGSQVQLQMEYHSTYYADNTVKQMQLQRGSDGNWRISVEKNLLVNPKPLARLVPGRTLTFNGGLNTIIEHAL